jgi:hypothetical protein
LALNGDCIKTAVSSIDYQVFTQNIKEPISRKVAEKILEDIKQLKISQPNCFFVWLLINDCVVRNLENFEEPLDI